MVSTAATSESGGARKLVCFFLGEQEYAADIDDIAETMTLRPITPVFLTPAWLLGIINVRGDIVAVIDVAQILGLPSTRLNTDSRIVIARWGDDESGREKIAGLVVDRMADVRVLDLSTAQPPPPTLPDSGGLLHGIVTVDSGRAVRILDLPVLFESEQLRAFHRKR